MKVNADDIFAYNIALYVIGDIGDRELKYIKDYICNHLATLLSILAISLLLGKLIIYLLLVE